MENPAETSAPDPERADEMLVLRCPPRHRQTGDLPVLSLRPATRNRQIDPPPGKPAAPAGPGGRSETGGDGTGPAGVAPASPKPFPAPRRPMSEPLKPQGWIPPVP